MWIIMHIHKLCHFKLVINTYYICHIIIKILIILLIHYYILVFGWWHTVTNVPHALSVIKWWQLFTPMKTCVSVVQVMERLQRMRHLSVLHTLFQLPVGSITLRSKSSVKDEMGKWRIFYYSTQFNLWWAICLDIWHLMTKITACTFWNNVWKS